MSKNGKINNEGVSPFSVMLIFIALTIIGVAMVPLLNIQLKPSRSLPALNITYNWPDASAKVLEREVTAKLEGMLGGMAGLEEISSVSSKGWGQVSLSFKKTTDLDLSRFEVSTLIRRLYNDFPKGVSYPLISAGSNDNQNQTLLTYTISAGAPPYYIQQYVEDNIVPGLSAIESVNDIKVYGANPFEWVITTRADLLKQLGLTTADVSTAVSNYFRHAVVGNFNARVDPGHSGITVLLENQLADTLSWDKIPIAKNNGRIVYLNDIANVSYKEQEPDSYYRINGLNTINMVISSSPGSNAIKTAGEVKSKIQQIEEFLPAGFNLLLSYDASAFIGEDLTKIGLRSLFSIVILLLFIVLITRQKRYVLLIIFSLLINLAVAVILYILLKLEIHLYSLAGITVSFGIIIDNSIIMIDHYRHYKNKKVFLGILAATLTTMGSLSVVFFLKESQRINLVDFVWVMLANLLVSLFVALFFIPAFMQQFPFRTKSGKVFIRRKRRVIRFNRLYLKEIAFSKRFKWAFLLVFILGFGIPVQWLPEKIENESRFARAYNQTLGSEGFGNARPALEKIMGGSLRLFSENVFESSFYAEPERTKLYIRGSMPEGCTVEQLNQAITKMEQYLSRFDELKMFVTSITSYRNASITVHFKPEYEFSAFPFHLKGLITSRAISLGGLDWSVYGVGRGFSNAIHSGFKSSQITLNGYNYNQLYAYAERLKDSLAKNSRVRDIEIAGKISWQGSNIHEYYIDVDHEMFALHSVSMKDFYNTLRQNVYSSRLQPVFDGHTLTPVTLISGNAASFNTWWLSNDPLNKNDNIVKMPQLGTIGKRKTGNEIHKNNQQYKLVVAWDFIGPPKLAGMVVDDHIEAINQVLPMGYKAFNQQYAYWNKKDKTQYYLIFLVIGIIYFICAILLESLTQPMAIILLVPISFIGVFLTFYLFDLNFDQGGFAAFILLSGLTVNAGLYIVNDFNNLARQNIPGTIQRYIKAYNYKIMPVFLTVISTLLGLIPFIWGGQNEVFWFAFAAGTMGGLLFSMIALFIYFPLFLRLQK